MKGQFRVINSQQSLDAAIQELREKWHQSKWLMMQTTTEKQRSQLQNNSLHLWSEWYASKLNEMGFDVRHVINETMKKPDVPWTGSAFKALVIHPITEAVTGKKSTSSMSSSECVVVSDSINKIFGERAGIFVPWPCKENMGAKQ